MQPSAQELGKKQGGQQSPKGAEEKSKSKAAGEAPAPHITTKSKSPLLAQKPREKWGTHLG
jgi:hypothetical protein